MKPRSEFVSDPESLRSPSKIELSPIPSVVPDGGDPDSSACTPGSTPVVELFKAPFSTSEVEEALSPTTLPSSTTLSGSTEGTSVLVPSVTFVSVELESSTGCTVRMTGEGKERVGCDLVISPWPQPREDLSAFGFSVSSVLIPPPKVTKVTGFIPCGVINQG